MNRFYIAANVDKDPGLIQSRKIQDYLIRHGSQCEIEGIKRVYDDPLEEAMILQSIKKDTDCVIVLGGDGTMIQVADAVAKRGFPIIGVNLGRLGYLTEVECDNVYLSLDRLLNNEYDIEERMMLTGSVSILEQSQFIGDAINDIVISRSGSLRILNFDIYVNNKLLNTYSADGIIVATPTGSTGYNMSAGGPIVEPNANLIMLTPICPHTLSARSIILSDSDDIRIELSSVAGGQDRAHVSFDGGRNVELESGDSVSIRKSENSTRIIKMSRESFLDVLSRKMSEG